jgi:hypothetical protein
VVYNGLYNKLSSQEKLLTQKTVLAIPSHSCYARRRRAAFSKSKKRTGKKPKIKLQCKSDAKNRFKGRKPNKYCRGTSLLFSLFFTTFKAFFHSTTFCFLLLFGQDRQTSWVFSILYEFKASSLVERYFF